MAEAKVTINVDINGLGKGVQCKDTFINGTTPEAAIHIPQQQQETADLEEALKVGSVDTITGVWIKAIENDIAVDTSWVTPTFNTELVIAEGTSQFFVPSGVVHIKNNTEAEKITFESVIFGGQD